MPRSAHGAWPTRLCIPLGSQSRARPFQLLRRLSLAGQLEHSPADAPRPFQDAAPRGGFSALPRRERLGLGLRGAHGGSLAPWPASWSRCLWSCGATWGMRARRPDEHTRSAAGSNRSAPGTPGHPPAAAGGAGGRPAGSRSWYTGPATTAGREEGFQRGARCTGGSMAGSPLGSKRVAWAES